jgi:ATP-dependent helicase/DNAse subunit B
MPHIHKDEDFLYDKIKPSILENTSELNELEEEKCKNALLGIKNKTITLKKNHNGPMRPSPLLTEIKEIKLDYSTYSNKINEYNLIDSLDLKRKYGMISKNLHTLQNHYPIAYQSYDSTFKKVPKEKILEKVNHNLVLSYSSLNQYYECAYHFYLDHILRLLPYTQNFKAYLGSLCHAILEEKPNDLNIFKENYMQTHPYNFTYKDLFFIDKIIKEMPSILEFEKELQKHSTFKIEKTEEKLYYKLDTKTDITLMGIIDKMMLNESHVSVIDYKTGQVKIQLNDVIHGLSMQLPIYALLIAKNFQDKKIAGIFIQNILENNFKNIKNKTIKEQKENSLRLNGYMIDNEDIISKFDSTYLDSRFIASMKKSKNGFYPYTKILSETKLNNLINLAEEKVKEAAFAIENADFKINPKKLRGENISCAYCPFKDICYFDKEEIELENKEDLSFLGGEV